MIHQLKLEIQTSKRRVRVPTAVEYKEGRIWFLKSPFALKDEIKAMQGSKWHGFEEENPRKIWSIDDCQRNRFQLSYLAGEDVYGWFDRPLQRHEYRHPLMDHQKELADAGLTYHYQIFAAEMGAGKSLSAQMVIEKSGVRNWWWVGPKTSLPNMRREFTKWDFPDIPVEFMTFEGLVRKMDEYKSGDLLPQGVICDESSRLKNWSSQRSRAAQMLADLVREKYGFDGYVILMSGTPSPKSPIDWWSQTEIAWPGFLREGSPKALQHRLAIIEQVEVGTGVPVPKLVSWKDDEAKCAKCGRQADEHDFELDGEPCNFEPSRNEVAYMYERLKGLVIVKHLKDCISLPERRYRVIECKPSSSVLRVAKALVHSAPNTITGLTWLRELSDGFQYKDVSDGEATCNYCQAGKVLEWFDPQDPDRTYSQTDMLNPELVARLQEHKVQCPNCGGKGLIPKKVRVSKEVPCPKDRVLKDLIEECEENGRIVVFAGFTGSVDRVTRLCRQEGWSVVRCDGRGWSVTDREENVLTSSGDDALEYWSNRDNPRVAFVAHPESGGMSLTLTESRLAFFWSNSFKPEYRIQAEARIHRPSMDLNLGCTIVDAIHLPSDTRVLDIIRENRRLEMLTMGEVLGDIQWESNDK